MAQKNQLPGNISIDQIRISIATCPGCEREHEFAMKRPTTSHNCGRGKGTFSATAYASGDGTITVNVSFTGTDNRTSEITKDCVITFV